MPLFFLLPSAQVGDLKQCLTSSCCLSKEEWKQGHSHSGSGTQGWPSKEFCLLAKLGEHQRALGAVQMSCRASQDYLAPAC